MSSVPRNRSPLCRNFGGTRANFRPRTPFTPDLHPLHRHRVPIPVTTPVQQSAFDQASTKTDASSKSTPPSLLMSAANSRPPTTRRMHAGRHRPRRRLHSDPSSTHPGQPTDQSQLAIHHWRMGPRNSSAGAGRRASPEAPCSCLPASHREQRQQGFQGRSGDHRRCANGVQPDRCSVLPSPRSLW